MPIEIAIIGFGKIARDQHLPVLSASKVFRLRAVAGPHSENDSVQSYEDIESLLGAMPSLSSIVVCTPPQARYHIARYALERGLHVMLEKPPAMSVGETSMLVETASVHRSALFAAWHSRYASGVEPARAWLIGRQIASIQVTWKENVKDWHPGQRWIWQAAGLGVFDPGINAISILTHLVAGPLVVDRALLYVPKNSQAPSSVEIAASGRDNSSASLKFDFLHVGTPVHEIKVVTASGDVLTLSSGGARMAVNGVALATPPIDEYAALYQRFEELIQGRIIDVDVEPMRLVADVLLSGRRIEAPAVNGIDS